MQSAYAVDMYGYLEVKLPSGVQLVAHRIGTNQEKTRGLYPKQKCSATRRCGQIWLNQRVMLRPQVHPHRIKAPKTKGLYTRKIIY